MLIERISNPWIKFKLLHLHPNTREEEKSSLAKQAFLFVISRCGAYQFKKEAVLDEIAEDYPEIVSDQEMLESFQYFCQEEAERKNKIVSPAELNWINKFIRSAAIRVQAEKLIYRIILSASSYWDKMRKNFSWTISDDEKLKLVREVLLDKKVGFKRKFELAQEFNEPTDDFIRPYYRKLLYDRLYDKAEELGISDPQIVLDVVVANIDNGYFRDALEIVKRFLPEREHLVVEIEIQKIIAVFNN